MPAEPSLDTFIKKLNSTELVRVNRSAIVRLESIRELQPWFHGEYKIVMTDGTTIPWTRRYITAGASRWILKQLTRPRAKPVRPNFRAARTISFDTHFMQAILDLLVIGDVDWTALGRDAGRARYSPVAQVTGENVIPLKPSWEYHTAPLPLKSDPNGEAALEATPIIVDGTLCRSTPFNQVIVLKPATGKQRWKFDPEVGDSVVAFALF